MIRSLVPLALLLCACAPRPSAAPGGAAAHREGLAGEAVTAESAARSFLATLAAPGRALALLPFEGPKRMEWYFTPVDRDGLPLKRMDASQRAAAHALLATGLSESGLAKAREIIAHELILRELELAAGRADAVTRRDPELYYASIFGTPGDPAWGWRFEGHHLSVNATVLGGGEQVVAPLFFGANPARVPSGPQAGLRILAAEEDLARELLALLDPPRLARALVSDTTYGDMRTRNDPKARPLPAEGLPVADMTAAQRAKLRELLEHYAARFPAATARRQLGRVDEAGFERLRFVWAGSTRPGEAHYYRIHGPTALIEYDNTQNDANHVHTVWRDLENDFGGDLLSAHYRSHAH